jgi:CBS domain containing-hemolysin-like protein
VVEFIIISFVTLLITTVGSFISAAFGGVSHHHLTELAEAGDASAQKVLDFKRDSDPPRSALFLIDTVVSTLGCIGIGGYAVVVFDNVQAVAVSLAMTLILLVLGRMLPRALGKRYAVSLVRFVERSLTLIMLILKPIVTVVAGFFALFAPPERDDEEIIREELDEILETAHDEGSLDAEEYKRLKNFVRFNEVYVLDVMTPRTVIFSCPCHLTVEEAIKLPEMRQYSRFPVYEEDSIDSVVGYVLTKDIFWSLLSGQKDVRLRNLSREVYFIPENIDLDRALQNFLERREHLFVVVDEYGGVEGLLTMEDVMETLLGVEILDEMDKVSNLRHLAAERRDERIASLRAQNAHVDDSADGLSAEITTDESMIEPTSDADETKEQEAPLIEPK